MASVRTQNASSETIFRLGVSAGVAGLAAFLAYRLWSAPRSVKPGINAHFANETAKPAEFVQRFETESREIYNKMQVVVDALQIPSGCHVADVGAGTGLFLQSLATAVGPTGQVYGVDPAKKFLHHMKERVADMPSDLQSRILIQPNTDFSIGDIPAGSLDLVIAIDTYHHFEYPTHIVRSIFASLKSGGRFAVLDFERIPGVSSEWVLGHVRAGQETVTREIESCGFVVHQQLKAETGLEENYLTVFVKP